MRYKAIIAKRSGSWCVWLAPENRLIFMLWLNDLETAIRIAEKYVRDHSEPDAVLESLHEVTVTA